MFPADHRKPAPLHFAVQGGRVAWLLTALLSLFVLPLAGGTYWMYLQSAKEIEKRELAGDVVRARTLAAIVDKDLSSAELILTSIADRPSLQAAWARRDLPAIEMQLAEARKLEPAFLFASVYEPDATLRAIVPADPLVGRNFAYRDWYHGLTAGWQPYVSEVYRTDAGSKPLVVAVAVPIRDPQGNVSGILMATYGLSELAAKFTSLEQGSWQGFTIVDQHGVIAASADIAERSQPVNLSLSGLVGRALAGSEGSVKVSADGQSRYVGYAPVPRLGWAALYIRPESQTLTPALHLKREFRTASIYLLLVYLATAAFAAFLVQHQRKLLAANEALNRELEAKVSDLKHTQQALVAARDVAERSNKFKDQFLSTMSHELRTPLNAILGFSDLLTEERYGPLTDKQKRYLQHIRNGGRHLLRLINDILDISKIEAGRLQLAIESVPLNRSFAEAADTLNPLASQKSQTIVRHPAPDLNVRADATRLKQILINLLANAVKFTPEGGKIELSAKAVEGSVRVEVRDSGPGISAEEQKKIFDAFYRIGGKEQKIEGTGLGLAITQRLVEVQGGKIGIESQVGSGSCFYFTLPSVPAVEPAADTKQAALPIAHIAGKIPAIGKSPVILVVEDDRVAASLLDAQLTAVGYKPEFCFDPTQAVEMAARMQPAAVTLDVLMKPLNGWEVLTKLKSNLRTAAIPVIIVSILDQRATGSLLGADEYIVKPVEKAVLIEAVQRCLERAKYASGRPILVVEDDLATREFIAESLSQRGHAVATAADGEQARFQMGKEMPKLVILDLILPKISGFELLAEWRINPRTADMPVFVLTSKDLTPEERTYLEANSTSLLQKKPHWDDSLLKCLQKTVPSAPAKV